MILIQPHGEPVFTDAEVITIGLMQGCWGVAMLKKTYLLIALNYGSAFPHWCSYKQWIARSLITPAEAGDRRALVSTVRERLETFSPFWRRLADRVFSRSWLGL